MPGINPVNGLLAAGAVEAQTLAEICPQADIILLCVTGAPEVEAILFEKGGVFDQARAGQIVLDCSTSLPTRAAALQKNWRTGKCAMWMPR